MRSPFLRLLSLLTFLPLAALSFTIGGCPTETEETTADAGPDASDPCKLGYAGDPEADIELEVAVLDPDYHAEAVAEGGDASILVPPQGGRVIFAGVRAKNINPCAVLLSGALRDPATDQVRIDTRTVNLDPTDDGWAISDETDISSFSNIPVCSNNWASTDVFDQTFTLIVSVKDRDGKKASVEVPITPRCDEMKVVEGQDIHAECLCLCEQGYVTGQTCP